MAGREEIVAALSQFALFADLSAPQLEMIAGELGEAYFADGTRILRQGLSGSGLYFILEGACSVVVNGEKRAELKRGEFFGEVSALLERSPTADVVATGPVRCLVLPAPEVSKFLIGHPPLMFRMLQVQARRLAAANAWRG